MLPPVSVVLIRENAEQLTGSGCCGKLEGDDSLLDCRELFRHTRLDQEALGRLHRAVRAFYPPEKVSLETVDPRNQFYLIPKLTRDVWRYRPGFWAGLRTFLQLYSLPAVIVNGQVISRRHHPVDADTLCHRIAELLGTPCPSEEPQRNRDQLDLDSVP